MDIKIKYIDDIVVLEVEGRVNINSSKLIETVGSLVEEGLDKIIIDMQDVEFVDYNGLSVLAIAYKSALNNKAVMKLCGISLHILELLRIVKLDEVFEIYRDVEEALDSFKQKHRPGKEELIKAPLRRRFIRMDMDMPLHYKLCGRHAHRGEGQLYSGRMANISGAGVFMRTINVFPPGTEVDMEIALDKEKKSKSLRGTVLWIADKELQPDLYPGMGVAFTELSPRTQEEVIEFIEKNIVHRRG